MSTTSVTKQVHGHLFTADLNGTEVTILRDGLVIDRCAWHAGRIAECSAMLVEGNHDATAGVLTLLDYALRERMTLAHHEVWMVHSPYPDGSWRGLEKCLGTPSSVGVTPRPGESIRIPIQAADFAVFQEEEAAHRYADYLNSDVDGEYIRPVRVTLTTPSVRGPLV